MMNKTKNLLSKTAKFFEHFLNTFMFFYADYFKHIYRP